MWCEMKEVKNSVSNNLLGYLALYCYVYNLYLSLTQTYMEEYEECKGCWIDKTPDLRIFKEEHPSK